MIVTPEAGWEIGMEARRRGVKVTAAIDPLLDPEARGVLTVDIKHLRLLNAEEYLSLMHEFSDFDPDGYVWYDDQWEITEITLPGALDLIWMVQCRHTCKMVKGGLKFTWSSHGMTYMGLAPIEITQDMLDVGRCSTCANFWQYMDRYGNWQEGCTIPDDKLPEEPTLGYHRCPLWKPLLSEEDYDIDIMGVVDHE